jgi:hypothetical protein
MMIPINAKTPMIWVKERVRRRRRAQERRETDLDTETTSTPTTDGRGEGTTDHDTLQREGKVSKVGMVRL